MAMLTVKPRVQKDKWSLYWKAPMVTKTEYLDNVRILAKPSWTTEELLREVAAMCGWEPVERLIRLDGFEEPWEVAICRGVQLEPSKTLQESGVGDGAEV